jgi:hypothetical protein
MSHLSADIFPEFLRFCIDTNGETSEILLEYLPSSVVAMNFSNLSETQGVYERFRVG